MSDKDFKVKNKLQVKGITSAGPVVSDASGNLDSISYVPTQYGGTGTTTSPSAGQLLYSASGTTYAPTNLSSLTLPGSVTVSDSAPSNPTSGQLWLQTNSTIQSFDPNILRRQSFTATAGQTVFTTPITFIEGTEQVFYNGMLLLRTTDYTTSNSNTVTLGLAATVNDIIEVVSVTNLNAYTATPYSSINSNITLVAGYRYFVDTTAARTLTLPASPSVNNQIEIFDATGTANTYNITVNRNNGKINGIAGNLIIDTNGAWYTLVYTGSTYGWKVA